jgi:ABC-type dipeptide/oligopeptide/nickel transport system ATPase component
MPTMMSMPRSPGFATRIGVMKSGRLVEMGPAENVIYHPGDAYTRSLLDSVIELNDERLA